MEGRVIPTTAELLAEVAAAMAHVPQQGEDVPPRTYTGTELKKAMGWGGPTMTANLTALIASGAVTVVRIRRRAVDGRLATIAAYQFAAPAKPAKRAG